MGFWHLFIHLALVLLLLPHRAIVPDTGTVKILSQCHILPSRDEGLVNFARRSHDKYLYAL